MNGHTFLAVAQLRPAKTHMVLLNLTPNEFGPIKQMFSFAWRSFLMYWILPSLYGFTKVYSLVPIFVYFFFVLVSVLRKCSKTLLLGRFPSQEHLPFSYSRYGTQKIYFWKNSFFNISFLPLILFKDFTRVMACSTSTCIFFIYFFIGFSGFWRIVYRGP